MSDGGIRYNDRALVLGDTGAGKSELINWFFELFSCQRLLLDSKDEFSIPDVERSQREGRPVMLKAVHDPGDIDWRAPVIHYVPKRDGKAGIAEMDGLFRACYESRGPLMVFQHEVSDVCGYQPAATPEAYNAYISKGRARGKGILVGSQLPFHMPVRAKTLNQHVLVMVPRFVREDDLDAIAKMVGADRREFPAQLDELHDALGDHAFLWFDRRTREIRACKPLDQAARSRITIRRRVDG